MPRPSVRVACAVFMAAACLRPPMSHGAAPSPLFRAVTLDERIEIGYGLAVADVDGDGKVDVILADRRQIVWYRNPDWSKHVMAERLTELDHVCVAAMDIDGDGKAEVAAGAGWNPGDTIGSGALFYLKAPSDRTQRWEPIRLAHDPTIHRLRWTRNSRGTFDLVSIPLHGRGNKNGKGDGVRVLAYRPPSDPAEAWTTALWHDRWHATHNAEAVPGSWLGARTTGDALLLGGREGIAILVQGEGGGVMPIQVAVGGTDDFVGAGEVRVGRWEGRMGFVAAVEPMHGHQVVVYRAPGVTESRLVPWRRRVIDETLVDGHGVVCADFLGTGRDQIVAGWRAMNRPGVRVGLRLYRGPATAEGEWVSEWVDDNGMACEDLQVADLDGDGDPDLVASGRATHNVKIYLNQRASGRD